MEFKELKNSMVERMFIVLWPPYGEEKISQVDISVGLVLENNPNCLFILTTDVNDLWTPTIRLEDIPSNNLYPWESFPERVQYWMAALEEKHFDFEYYEVTNAKMTFKMIQQNIKDVQMVFAGNIEEPFGVKLLFEDDYILSIPITDGNTIETSQFNQNDCLNAFMYFGKIAYRSV